MLRPHATRRCWARQRDSCIAVGWPLVWGMSRELLKLTWRQPTNQPRKTHPSDKPSAQTRRPYTGHHEPHRKEALHFETLDSQPVALRSVTPWLQVYRTQARHGSTSQASSHGPPIMLFPHISYTASTHDETLLRSHRRERSNPIRQGCRVRWRHGDPTVRLFHRVIGRLMGEQDRPPRRQELPELVRADTIRPDPPDPTGRAGSGRDAADRTRRKAGRRRRTSSPARPRPVGGG